MAFDPKVIGNPRLKTQHLVGASKWMKTSEIEITGHLQMRVAHQKYADEKMTEIAAKGHAHSKGTMWYRRVDGVWKFAGIEPGIRWSEYDHDKIFEEGEEKFGAEGSQPCSIEIPLQIEHPQDKVFSRVIVASEKQ